MSIIIEGPDGSGKSTLLSHLQEAFPYIDTHERFSTSVGGPVDDLRTRVRDSVNNSLLAMPQFFDRHPFISEFIYGPLLRGGIKDGLDELESYRHHVLSDALIILCLPEIEQVKENIAGNAEDQMNGVLSHIDAIYDGYNEFHRQHQGDNLVWYDYTFHSTAFVERQIRNYIAKKRDQIDLFS